jgi:hypothetical protein
MTEQEIINRALDALNELNPERKQDDETILRWVVTETKNLKIDV